MAAVNGHHDSQSTGYRNTKHQINRHTWCVSVSTPTWLTTHTPPVPCRTPRPPLRDITLADHSNQSRAQHTARHVHDTHNLPRVQRTACPLQDTHSHRHVSPSQPAARASRVFSAPPGLSCPRSTHNNHHELSVRGNTPTWLQRWTGRCPRALRPRSPWRPRQQSRSPGS